MKLTQGSSFAFGIVSTLAAVALWFVGSAAVAGSTKAVVCLIGAALFGLTAFILNIVIPVQKKRRSQVVRRRLDDYTPGVAVQLPSQHRVTVEPATMYALQQGAQNQAVVHEVIRGFLDGTIVRNPEAAVQQAAVEPARPKLVLLPSLQKARPALVGPGAGDVLIHHEIRPLFKR